MQLTDQHRAQLQKMMSGPLWGGFEAFVQNFMMKEFATASIKRQTEFDTVWYAAEMEGGKRLLTQFLRELDEEARKVETD